ncbi:MAG: cytochrome c biogenesis protein CcdA [Tissierellia bacterium]|jgi:cytochrome c biogenesis protein CcdA|nr:cytochrome c biogenesis protein CcdA [Tissierellia bacterium]
MINLDSIVNLIANETTLLVPLFAILGGVLASTLPCSLAGIPLIITYVGGAGAKEPKTALKLSLLFALGSAVVFTALGLIAAVVGRFFGTSSTIWNIILAVVFILMSLQLFGIYEFVPSINLLAKNKRRGMAGAFLTGMLAGVFSSPCATPILVALMAVVARGGSLAWAGLLFFLYSVGHSILVVIAGTSFGLVDRMSASGRYQGLTKLLQFAFGLVLLGFGIYLLYMEM